MKYNEIIMEMSKNEYISLKDKANDIKNKINNDLLTSQMKNRKNRNLKRTKSKNTKNELTVEVDNLNRFYINDIKGEEANIGSFSDIIKVAMILYKNIIESNSEILNQIKEKEMLEKKYFRFKKPHLSVLTSEAEIKDFNNKKLEFENKINSINSKINSSLKILTGEIFNTYSTFIKNGDVVDFKTNIIRLSYIVNRVNNFKMDYSKILKDDYFKPIYNDLLKELDQNFKINPQLLNDLSDAKKIETILTSLFDEHNNILNVINLIVFTKHILDETIKNLFDDINTDNINILSKDLNLFLTNIANNSNLSKTSNNLNKVDYGIDYIKSINNNFESSLIDSNTYEPINNKTQTKYSTFELTKDNDITITLNSNLFLELINSIIFTNSLKNIKLQSNHETLNIINDMKKIESGNDEENITNINSIMTKANLLDSINDDLILRYNIMNEMDLKKLNKDELKLIDDCISIIIKKSKDYNQYIEILKDLINYWKYDYNVKTLEVDITNNKGKTTTINIKLNQENSQYILSYTSTVTNKVFNKFEINKILNKLDKFKIMNLEVNEIIDELLHKYRLNLKNKDDNIIIKLIQIESVIKKIIDSFNNQNNSSNMIELEKDLIKIEEIKDNIINNLHK